MQLEEPLGYMLGQIIRIFKSRLIARFKESNIELSHEQFVILLLISSNEDMTQQDLANHLIKDKSVVLRQINSLIEKRYVVRLPDKHDKRKKNLILTQKGVETLSVMKEIGKKVSDELFYGVNDKDIEGFKKVFDKIEENDRLNA